jgi:hypothetical protein
MTTTEYHNDDEQWDEDEPLLQDDNLQRTDSHTHPFLHTTHSPRIIIALIFAIIFVLACGGQLMAVPAIRLYEDIICHLYYENLDGEGHVGPGGYIDEKQCKGDEVQGQLNVLLAVLHFLSAIPGDYIIRKKYGLKRANKGL